MKLINAATLLASVSTSCILFSGPAQAALNIWSNNGEMHVSGEAGTDDVAKLKERLTPDIRTIVLFAPTSKSWAVAKELADIVETAKVRTVARGWCSHFACSMMFLAGKERMFSADIRPEASAIRMGMSFENFPDDAGDDARRPWSDVTTWWREHTNLSRADFWPRHRDTVRMPGTQPAENLFYFHPSAKTSKGSSWECFGRQQDIVTCLPNSRNADALTAGIITTEERYTSTIAPKPVKDVSVPVAASGYARIDDLPLRIDSLNDGCNDSYRKFLQYDAPRAFVVSSSGGCYYTHAQVAAPYDTAMDNCTKNAATRSDKPACRYYAVDDRVVFQSFTRPIKPEYMSIQLGKRLSAKQEIEEATDSFSLSDPIALLLKFNFPEGQDMGRQRVEARWYIDGNLVHTSRRTTDMNTSSQWISFRPKMSEIGTGKVKIDVYANDIHLGSKNLEVRQVR